VHDLLNGVVGAVVCGLEFAGRLVMDIGAVVKAAVGEGAAEAFVKDRKRSATCTPFGVSR
jgi:hypothetical protein